MTTRPLLPIITAPSDINAEIIRTRRTIKLDKSFTFNFVNGDFDLTGGNIPFVSELANLKQWIAKTLDTASGHYIVYNRTYGNVISDILGTIKLISNKFKDLKKTKNKQIR